MSWVRRFDKVSVMPSNSLKKDMHVLFPILRKFMISMRWTPARCNSCEMCFCSSMVNEAVGAFPFTDIGSSRVVGLNSSFSSSKDRRWWICSNLKKSSLWSTRMSKSASECARVKRRLIGSLAYSTIWAASIFPIFSTSDPLKWKQRLARNGVLAAKFQTESQ